MAREYYATPPTQEELDATGLRREDLDVVEIWPDNGDAFSLLQAMETQWLVGPAGPYGLIYGHLDSVRRDLGIPPEKWPQLFADLKAMERAALDVIHEKKG